MFVLRQGTSVQNFSVLSSNLSHSGASNIVELNMPHTVAYGRSFGRSGFYNINSRFLAHSLCSCKSGYKLTVTLKLRTNCDAMTYSYYSVPHRDSFKCAGSQILFQIRLSIFFIQGSDSTMQQEQKLFVPGISCLCMK